MRPDQRNPQNRRPGAAPPPATPTSAPASPPKPSAGPRPLSARQQAHLQGTPLPPPPGPRSVTSSASANRPATSAARRPEASKSRRRPVAKKTVRAVRAPRSARNRRRVNVPRILLGWATFALAAECVVAALWSPRFWVRELIIEGNVTVATETLAQRLAVAKRTNLIRLSPRRLADVAGAEPAVEVAEIRRALPGTVRLSVRERTPWAAVQVGKNGAWYVMDRNLVPFRMGKKPEAGLPLLALETPTGATGFKAAKPVVLGKTIDAPGLNEVSQCLAWSSARPDFPLERITIDSGGKLCLNRIGGVRVTLGSGLDLERKLETLGLLLARRADLKGDGESQIASVNLIAYDAPALSLRKLNPLGERNRATPSSPNGARRRKAE